MFTPADLRFPLLLIKSKKLSDQPGMVLMGNPPRWHQINPGDEAPKDVHHALYKKGEIASAKKLSKDPEFTKLHPDEQVKKVQEHAKAVQDKNTASSKAATFIKKVISGQPPQAAEWKHWIAQSREKRAEDIAKFEADPQVKAYWDQAVSTFKAKAAANIERHKAEDNQSDKPEPVKAAEPQKERAVDADKKADTVEPVKAKESGIKPLDHGELNVPGKTNKINAELDKYKAQQAKQAKADQKSATVDKKANKAKAKELFAEHGQAMIDRYSKKFGKKETTDMLDDLVKWQSTKFILMVDKYLKELEAEKAESKQEPVAEPEKAEVKPEPVAESKPASESDDDYDAKIQEYATGATYKQKAYKLLSQDPEWLKLSGKPKFDVLHAKYLELQSAASLSGAMAKFKTALLSGKAPTKALVEKFNSLSKEDQAKVLKPVFEQKDKAEIGNLLEQSGAKPVEKPKADKPKHTFKIKPHEGGFKLESDNGGGFVANKPKGGMSLFGLPPKVFKTEADAQAYLDKKGMTMDAGESPKVDDSPKDGDTKQGADGLLVFKNGRWHKQGEPEKAGGDKVYLNVPFQKKDFAKQAGAKWDSVKKLWYAPEAKQGMATDYGVKINPGLTQFIPKEVGLVNQKGNINASALAENLAMSSGEPHEIHAAKNPKTGAMGYYVAKTDGTPAETGYDVLGNWEKQGPVDGDGIKQSKAETKKTEGEKYKDELVNAAKTGDGAIPLPKGVLAKKPVGLKGIAGVMVEQIENAHSVGDQDALKNIKANLFTPADSTGKIIYSGTNKKAVEAYLDAAIEDLSGEKKLTKKAVEALAYELGKKAHAAGYAVPVFDPELMNLIKQLPEYGSVSKAAYKAWQKGRIEAMAAAPIPGWSEDENAAFQQAVNGKQPAEPQTEIHHGAAWVAALAEGKKPDNDTDNAVVIMPEERQQELFTKAATLWAKGQKLDADEHGVALGKVVLSDVMNDREHQEGDTKTVNGVTYILQGGRWHRQTPKTKGEGTPAQKLAALQSLDTQALFHNITNGQASQKTDRHLDAMGPDAKATFYSMMSDYETKWSVIYKKGAIAAAVGHPNEVLTKTGQWVPFDPDMSAAATPPGIVFWQKALEEATLAAKDEPSSGPENPDTPQSFGHGTVTFTGAQKLHDLLSSKGWDVAGGPHHQIKFLSSKSIQDWSVSPAGWIDDKAVWQKSQWYLKDMFPAGAVVDVADTKWVIEHSAKSLDFVNQQTGQKQSFSKKEQVEDLLNTLWHKNPTIIPPGHPAGKKIRDEAADQVAVDSPTIEHNALLFKKVNGAWKYNFNDAGPWYDMPDSYLSEHGSALESKLAAAQGTSTEPAGPKIISGKELIDESMPEQTKNALLTAQYKQEDGQWFVMNSGFADFGNWVPIDPNGAFLKQHGAKLNKLAGIIEESPVITLTLPHIGDVNYKKVDGIWMTEDQKGNPDAGWHKINQDGVMVADLEQKLKEVQGGGYDLMQHPKVMGFIQSIGNGIKPSAGDKAFVDAETVGESYDKVFTAASEAYAKNHGLDPSDESDKMLAEAISLDLLLNLGHPQEGDTKTENGITYQLINGRWHRVTPKDEDVITDLPGYEGAKFKKKGEEWVYQTASGAWAPVINGSQIDKLDAHAAPKPKASPIDAVNIDEGYKTHAKAADKIEAGLNALKEKAKAEGISAWKGVISISKVKGTITVNLPVSEYQMLKLKIMQYHLDDPSTTNKPWLVNLVKGVMDMKVATKLASGKKPKKPKKVAPKETSSAPGLSSKTESIDDWKQIGGQGGYNPGGTYRDANGDDWYCKFPDGGEHNVKNELLAVSLYKAAGLFVPDVKLVTQNGKIGLASKIVQGAKEDKSWLKNGGGPGVLEGFAIDAWLANWDTVGNNPAEGKGFDNILKMPDGSAVRIDAGGALLYGGAGSLKGEKFGDVADEIESLRNPGTNPNTAQVFGKMSEADIKSSVMTLAQLDDGKIQGLVMQYGPGDYSEKKKLYEKLVARKNSIVSKFPDVQSELLKKKLAKFNWSGISTPPNFLNWGDSGKPGPATLLQKNEANQEGVNKLYEVAKTGNISAIRNLDFPLYDSGGTVTGYAKALDHPSQYVKGYAQQVINEINYQLNPPVKFRFTEGHPLAALDSAFPTAKVGEHPHKVGKFLDLGAPGEVGVEDLGLPEKVTYKGGKLSTSTYASTAKALVTKMPKYQLQAVQSYTGSGYQEMNNGLWKGNPSGAAKSAAEALHTLSHEVTPGTILSRKIGVHGSDLEQLVGALAGGKGQGMVGHVLQEPAIMSTSIDPDVWSGNVHIKMNIGPGVKGLYVGPGSDPNGGAVSSHASEKELLLPPNTRMIVNKIKKSGSDADGFGHGSEYIIEVTVLPTQE
jgi:hypothetical protein